MEDSKSKKKSHNNHINMENKKLNMKISSSKNGSGNIVSFILLGGALVTAALGSAFLVERKRRKSNKKITKNEKTEDDSSKGLHFLVPDDSSPCMQMQEEKQPSCNGTEKLGGHVNDSTTLFSTPCLIQDEKPKLEMDDGKRDAYNTTVSDADTQTDQIAKKSNLQMQVIDELEYFKENDQASSCHQEATSENRPCRSYSMVVQNLEAAVIKNDSIDFQHSAEVIQVTKDITAKDTADSGEQSLEAEHSSIQLVEIQSFETDCRENAVGGDKGASELQAVDIAIAKKDLEAASTQAEDEEVEKNQSDGQNGFSLKKYRASRRRNSCFDFDLGFKIRK